MNGKNSVNQTGNEALFEKWAEDFERENPEVLYHGGIPCDEDPADYYGFSVKAVRLG